MIAAVEIIGLNTGTEYSSTQPLCNLSTTNIGKYFLRLRDKHFNGNNPLKKINRKTF